MLPRGGGILPYISYPKGYGFEAENGYGFLRLNLKTGLDFYRNGHRFLRPDLKMGMNFTGQAPLAQRADNFIHWIVCYPADKMCAGFSRWSYDL